ncbi:MAG: PSD1 and planctomycete cytochrome C domain-containing protein [Opitutales bacterium]
MNCAIIQLSLAALFAHGLMGDAGADAPLSYWKSEIKPLLEQNCWKCHGADKVRAELVLTTREGVLKGGEVGPAVDLENPSASLMLQMVSYKDEDHQMPPIGKLSQEKIDALGKWIGMGLPFPKEDEIEPKIAHNHASTTEVNETTKSHWAYKKPVADNIPNLPEHTNPIDRFIHDRLAEQNLPANPQAEDHTLIRRMYYDLIGLPPTPEEVGAYVSNKEPTKFKQMVDRLLSSPHYGEKWGRHWLDLVRYAETNGYERDGNKPQAWRYRDYVINAFNQNTPYDQFILEQLAGDEIENPNAAAITATGFHRLGIWDDEPADRVLARYDYLDDIVRTTTEVFLGMTVGCARCHDHKIDPIPTKDYYSMLSFFANITPHGKREENIVEVKDSIGNITYQNEIEVWNGKRNHLQKHIVDFEEKFIAKYDSDTSILKSEKVRAKPVILLEDARSKGTQWNYLERKPSQEWIEVGYDDKHWNRGMGGFGSAGPKQKVGTKWGTSDIWMRSTFRLAAIPKTLRMTLQHDEDVEVYLNGKLVFQNTGHVSKYQTHDISSESADVLQTGKNVVAVHCRQTVGGQFIDLGLECFEEAVDLVGLIRKHGNKLMGEGPHKQYKARMRDLQRHLPTKPKSDYYKVLAVGEHGERVTKVLRRGNPALEGEEVFPAFPAVLSPPDPIIQKLTKSSGRRTALAKWIGSKDNPISARVMVNRIWQYHFGRGIVRSSSDFGYQGDIPTHPRLLDWLAIQFMESGWDIKAMHRLIMSSDAYKRSSKPNDLALAQDPLNQSFWRYDMRRLTSEEVRDSVLNACGTINLEMGGQSVTPPVPDIVLAGSSVKGKGWGACTPEQANRRSVYVKVMRSMQMPLLINHDMADTDSTCPVRFNTTVPTQALNMLNGKFMNDSAKSFANRLRTEAGKEPKKQVEHALKLVFSRSPQKNEINAGLEMMKIMKNKFSLSGEEALDRFALLALNLNEFVYLD